MQGNKLCLVQKCFALVIVFLWLSSIMKLVQSSALEVGVWSRSSLYTFSLERVFGSLS